MKKLLFSALNIAFRILFNKNFYLNCLLISLALLSSTSSAQDVQAENKTSGNRQWTSANPFQTDVFIENYGQFDSRIKATVPVKYAVNNADKIFFTAYGLIYRVDKVEPLSEKEREEIEHETGKEQKGKSETFYVYMNWAGSNKVAEIEAKGQTGGYYTFGDKGYEYIKAKGYKKLTYKNLYPGIDVEYSIPEKKGGIKYTVIVHPGADMSRVQMHYSGDIKNIDRDHDGNIVITTKAGNIIDHAPESFYEETGKTVSSFFELDGYNVRFYLQSEYDNSKTVLIDPWTTTPATLTTDNCAYDVASDDFGNIFISGGSSPFKLAKYNSTGTYQWTFTCPAGWGDASGYMCYSKFCIFPNSGTTFIGEGWYNMGPRVMKINTGGTLVLTSPSFLNNEEIWVMFYNRCIGKLMGFGGGTQNENNLQQIADTNLTSSIVNNFNGYFGPGNDIAASVMDINGDFYALMASANASNNQLLKCLVANGYNPPLAWDVPSGYIFMEIINNGIPGLNYSITSACSDRANALALNSSYLFSYDGKILKAWNKTNGALLGSVVVNAGYAEGQNRTHEGIAVDECNNIWVGGVNMIHVYSFNGTTFTPGTSITANITGEVFDINLNASLNLLAASGVNFLTTLIAPQCGVSLTVTDTSSGTCSNGTASVMVTGGTAPYHYLWSTGDTTSTITAPPGTYYVTVTDNSCILHVAIDTVVIAPIAQFNTSMSQTNVSCNGGNNGTATITVTGSTGPYTYLWNDPLPAQSTATATGLTAGVWTVTVTDNAGCSLPVNVTITEPAALLSATTVITDVLCYGQLNGAIDLTIAGGTSPYSVVWSSGQITEDLGNIPAGNYTVTITDANGCTYSSSFTVNQPNQVIAQFTVNDNSQCLPGNSFIFTNTGSTGVNIQYNWNFGGDGTSTLQNPVHSFLNTGIYNISQTVSFNGTCPQTATMNISVNNGPQANYLTDIEDCYMDCNGSITVNLIGNFPFSYLWNNGQTTQTATDLCGGNYIVIITDGNGCTINDTIQLASMPELFFTNAGSTPVSCFGYNDGTAGVSAGGGSGLGTYTFQWDANTNFQTSDIVYYLPAGTYYVTVTDNFGCTIDTSVIVSGPSMVTVSTTGVSLLCNGQSGTLSASANGGSGQPYSYRWFTFPPPDTISSEQTIIINPVSNSAYYVIAIDAVNCRSLPDTAIVSVRPPLNLTLECLNPYLCPGDTAVISIIPEGGTDGPYYIYQTDGSEQNIIGTTFSLIPDDDTTIFITLKDGCSIPVQQTINLFIYDPPPVTLSATPLAHCQPATIQFYANTTAQGLIFLWNFGDNNESNISMLQNPQHDYEDHGVFDITMQVTTPEGCVFHYPDKENALQIIIFRTPLANFEPNDDEANRVEPVVYFTNMSIPLTDYYIWDFGDGNSSDELHPQHTYPDNPREYTVQLIAINPERAECKDTIKHVIEISEIFTFYAPSAFMPDGISNENKAFRVYGHGIDNNHFHILIYDRWGEIIFETFNYQHGWDGKIKNGKFAPNGVYTWLVTFRDIQQNQHQKSGTVTLIR